MDNKSQNQEEEKFYSEETAGGQKRDRFLPLSIIASAVILAGAWIYTTGLNSERGNIQAQLLSGEENSSDTLAEKVLPSEGVVLPVAWGDLGAKLIEVGAIDAQGLESVYAARGGLDDDAKKLLYGDKNGKIRINRENSGVVLNLLWAFALANKNRILEEGPMTTYDGKEADSPADLPAEASAQAGVMAKAGRFASTGGWTLAVGNPMDHYSRHELVVLTPEQQQLVEAVSKNIYRPCCGNSTYFPDCNHGMAMLGLLELMASQGVSEKEMYRVALQVNSYWFPDTYLSIARYLETKGMAWDKVDPREILGAEFSSASGYSRILQELETAPSSNGGCGVDGGSQTQKPQGGGGCGV